MQGGQCHIVYQALAASAPDPVPARELVALIATTSRAPRKLLKVVLCRIRDHLPAGEEIVYDYRRHAREGGWCDGGYRLVRHSLVWYNAVSGALSAS